jgi:stringent starvation protein B
MISSTELPSTRPYLIRALYDWCSDNGFTPYVAVKVDASVQVPREYVQGGEIVLNVSMDATGSLKLGNEFIEFKARFGGKPCDIMVPIHRVMAIYARENGQGMSFPVTDVPMGTTVLGMDKLYKVPDATESTEDANKPVPPSPTRPTLTRIK